jgi:hypothetical protein
MNDHIMNGDTIKKGMIDRDTMNMDTIDGTIIRSGDTRDGDILIS